MFCIDHRLYTLIPARREVKITPPELLRKYLCVNQLCSVDFVPAHVRWTLHAYSNTLYED